MEYKVIKQISRPDKELIESFRNISVSNIDDCMNRSEGLHSSIKPINKAKMLGTAITVSVPPGENLLFYIAISIAQPGDVIAIADGGYKERALCGEIMVTLAQEKGITGFLTDGAIRDFDVLSQMDDFSVCATCSSPNGPIKNGLGAVNIPISLGGKIINPGDIIVGDSDGVVVISPNDAPNILKQAREIMNEEKKILENLRNGGEFDFSWIIEKAKADGCKFI